MAEAARSARRELLELVKQRPPCFGDRKVWMMWKQLAIGKDEQAPIFTLTRHAYCEDCTPQYQARMIAEGRCQHPGTIFDFDGDGLLRGTRPGGYTPQSETDQSHVSGLRPPKRSWLTPLLTMEA